MASKDVEFGVGITILAGIVLVAASIYWLQEYHLERNSQSVNVLFEDVGTLAVGDKVTVSGVHHGKVRDLKLTEDGVLVTLTIGADLVLKSDARIVIRNFGLMGERFIAITPGSDSEPLDLTQTVLGYYDTGLPEVMGYLGEMVVELRHLTRSLRRSIAADSTLDKFSRTADNLESISASLSGYLKRNESKLDETASNFVSASRDLKQLLADNRAQVDSTVSRMDRTSVKLDRFVGQLDSLAGSAREFAGTLNDPDGTLHLLLEDRRLYDDLRKTADNIDDLILDIKANPRKYINLKVELF
jgi:phospholipid/cholesterol/gamma-HCH transport system substrate-binding protein